MAQKKLQVVHYLNQFFGQQGGEDKAHMDFLVKKGPVGPGLALQNILGERGRIIATIICGDNYFAENIDTAAEEAIKLITAYDPDLFFAGPAFEAGRYGIACGAICKTVQERLGIHAITGMFEENPGVDLYRYDVYICKTGKSALVLVESLTNMVNLALKLISRKKRWKLVSGENIGNPSEDGYFPRGILKNEYTKKTAAERSVSMMLAKLLGKPFQSEVAPPTFKYIAPPPPIKDLGSCEIALVSDGGLVPRGNPDEFSGRGNQVWSTYEIESFFPEECSSTDYEIAHTGYFQDEILENPNRLVPVDVLRDLEKKGIIGRIHPVFCSTSGNVTSSKRCSEIGEEIAEQLENKNVDAVILTST